MKAPKRNKAGQLKTVFDILVVDDQATSLKIMQQLVYAVNPEARVHAFDDPVAALQWTRHNPCDLLITDLRMPVMNGIELTRWFRKLPGRADVPIVVVTIVDDRESCYRALEAGATDFLTKPLDHVEFRARCRNLLTLREQQKLIKDRARWLELQVSETVREIESREKDALLHLAKAGEYRDEHTGKHVQRMAKYCHIIAWKLGLSDAVCRTIEFAAPLHDIGKIGIPDDILLKPGKLTPAEFQVIKSHTTIGHDILKDSPSEYLQMGAVIALNHHEKFDGGGYPRGLAGEAIPLVARIVAVADVFDALMSVRPYKSAWSLQDTLAFIRDSSASHFDPNCVAAFRSELDKIQQIQMDYQDIDKAESR